MGLLDFNEWTRIVNKINFVALELVGQVKTDIAKHPTEGPTTSSSPEPYEPKILITYARKDREQADAVRRYLIRSNLRRVTSFDEASAGEEISRFAANKAQNANFLLALISANSLRDGWEGLQSHLDIFSNTLIQKNSIPLALDFSFAKPGFIEQEVERLDKQLDALDKEIQLRRSEKTPAYDLKLTEADITMLRNNLPKIVQRLRNVNVIDISGHHFETGMAKVLQIINSAIENSRPAYP